MWLAVCVTCNAVEKNHSPGLVLLVCLAQTDKGIVLLIRGNNDSCGYSMGQHHVSCATRRHCRPCGCHIVTTWLGAEHLVQEL